MNYVLGASTTQPGQQQGLRATGPAYQTGVGPTVTGGAAAVSNPDDSGQRLVQWQQSSAARAYEGQWVLLDPDSLVVLDCDISPSELLSRKPGDAEAAVVYVQPSGLVVI